MSITSSKGAAAEHMAAALLSSIGYTVYFPMDPNAKADLLVERNGEYLKVQVKCARWNRNHSSGSSERLRVSTTRHRGGMSGSRRSYAHGDFDLLCAIDGSRMWLIPFADCRWATDLTLEVRGAGRSRSVAKPYDPAKWLVK